MSTSQDLAVILEALEQRLRSSTAASDDRKKAFEDLVRFFGETLVVEARRQAAQLRLDPTCGDAAMSEAFINLARGLNSPWPHDKDFLVRFRHEIWKELRHRRAKAAKLRLRFPPLSDEDRPKAGDADPERQYRSSEQLDRVRQCMDRLSRTHSQRRLVKAWWLSKLGYGWGEVKIGVDWPGSPDSLRTSVSRLFSRMKGRLQKQAG